MKRTGLVLLLMVGTSVMCGLPAHAAPEFAVSVAGQIQGKFKGEGRKGFEDKIMGLSFDQEVVSPRDVITGQAINKRSHKLIKIKKVWGPASLQFVAAVTKNELLTVVMDFFVTDQSGMAVLDHTVKLTNASVASYKTSSDVSTTAPQTDTIEFVFQQIEITDHRGKGALIDNWIAP